MSSKILLTGCNGQVGFELQRLLAPLGDVTALDRSRCDLADPESLRAAIRATRPDIIVNPAAYTAVDKAESDEATAYAVNAIVPGILAKRSRNSARSSSITPRTMSLTAQKTIRMWKPIPPIR